MIEISLLVGSGVILFFVAFFLGNITADSYDDFNFCNHFDYESKCREIEELKSELRYVKERNFFAVRDMFGPPVSHTCLHNCCYGYKKIQDEIWLQAVENLNKQIKILVDSTKMKK